VVPDSRRRWQRRTIFDLLVSLTRASSITMFVCWRGRVPYDETTYFESLKRRASHLAKGDQQLPKPLENPTNNSYRNP
jgi:hypothetical protein